jgi:hypothetical protein
MAQQRIPREGEPPAKRTRLDAEGEVVSENDDIGQEHGDSQKENQAPVVPSQENEIDATNNHSSKKKRVKKPALKSWVHEYLQDHVRDSGLLVSAVCIICGDGINLRSGTNIAKSHLETNHKAEITVPTPAPKTEVPTVLSEQEKKELKKVYYDKAAVWVAHEAQPLTATERQLTRR